MLLDEERGESRIFRDLFKGQVNVTHEEVYKNIRRNIRRPLPQMQRHPANKYKVALLCGGPSLAEAQIPRGYKIATVNGTHDWALDRGLRPSIFMMVDARPHNIRFVQRPLTTCSYFLCSQVHPSVFDALDGYRVRIFHGAVEPERKILNKYYMGRWHNVPGGGSVGTRAIGLLYMLGVRKLRVFGMDGCLRRGKHHAYPQAENDTDGVRVIRVGRRRFRTHIWMVSQMDDFVRMVDRIPQDLELSFEGDGLIAHLVRETARLGRPPKVVMEK